MTDSSDDSAARWKKRANVALIGFLVVAGYFFVTEHRAHLSGFVPYLPFLLLLACPLMHIFMHGGHGQHGRGEKDPPGSTRPRARAGHTPARGDSASVPSSHRLH